MKHLRFLIGWILVIWHGHIYKRNQLKTSLSRLALLYERVGCRLMGDSNVVNAARQDLAENVAVICTIISLNNREIAVTSELIELRHWVNQDRLKFALNCIDESQLFALVTSHQDIAEKIEKALSAA